MGEVVFDLSRAHIVGILNVTPDSFSDGGQFLEPSDALARGRALARAGADIIDVGGESTRPGATKVSVDEEIERVVPVISELASIGVPISVDTTKAAVAEAAIDAGATLVNDISGGLFDDQMIRTVARRGVGYVLGHVRGAAIDEVHAALSEPPTAADVEIELARRLEMLPESVRQVTIVDPGLGFGKPKQLNLELTRNSGALSAALQCAVMIGPSRKRYLGALTGHDATDRDVETVGAALAAVACGAQFVRVHAVDMVRRALTVFEASTR